MNREGVLYTVIFTFTVSFFFVALLALSNEFTKAKVERNRVLSERRAVLNVFGIETAGTDADYDLYDRRISESKEGDLTLYEAQVNGQRVEAIRFSGSGLWGTITGVVAVLEDMSRIIGLDIISHNETPGLGGRIAEAWFKEQFQGEKIVGGRIQVQGTGGGDTDKDNGRVDAITGATRTSQALENILNQHLQAIERLRGKR
jgi:Na+-transporting NADH:ubiquinone oxidoreductase subunit C